MSAENYLGSEDWPVGVTLSQPSGDSESPCVWSSPGSLKTLLTQRPSSYRRFWGSQSEACESSNHQSCQVKAGPQEALRAKERMWEESQGANGHLWVLLIVSSPKHLISVWLFFFLFSVFLGCPVISHTRRNSKRNIFLTS